MKTFKTKFSNAIRTALEKGYPSIENLPSVDEIYQMLEYPPNDDMGDLAFPCFKLSKSLRAAPPMIANTIMANIGDTNEIGASKVESVSGYLNITISDKYFSEKVMNDIKEKGENYGASNMGEGKTVVLDYSSPNIAKPFHIGHLGTTVIGHCLKLLHSYAGYKCIGINYLGDWGTQFGKLIVAYKKWGSKEQVENGGVDELVSLYVRFHKEAEENEALNDEARAEFRKLEDNDEENIALWKWFKEVSLEEYQKTYKQLGISFDSYNGESFYTDKMPEQIEALRNKNMLKIDDGASIVDLSEYNMPPCLILKRDGSTLYPTRDIAAAVYRSRTYNFDKCIYVTSGQQSLHFAQWFKVAELMGYDFYKGLVHVSYGTCSINGAKLSSRNGNVVLLRDLFQQSIEKVRSIMDEKNPNLPNKEETAQAVGVGAMVFYYLSYNRNKDINFVLEDALSFDGNTGPYAQYTYARTKSILSKPFEDKGYVVPEALEPSERSLIKSLSLFPEKVLTAIHDYEPSIITRYILDVCNSFNRFYQSCSVNNAENDNLISFRRALTKNTSVVLAKALELICMKHPDQI